MTRIMEQRDRDALDVRISGKLAFALVATLEAIPSNVSVGSSMSREWAQQILQLRANLETAIASAEMRDGAEPQFAALSAFRGG